MTNYSERLNAMAMAIADCHPAIAIVKTALVDKAHVIVDIAIDLDADTMAVAMAVQRAKPQWKPFLLQVDVQVRHVNPSE